ncbi:hypothetical protein [Mesonia sp. K4-1]|uniref:hypothetical protein n=1 Tax=Mesonia sp. K4-1 TaxID=2602760 RepID=UPI0011C887E3|nr:hypothetical protein [Mesonia sp. K4-1]TXK74938.1 hypothetical protein FT986_10545 [Mesonia sp. K4-1]
MKFLSFIALSFIFLSSLTFSPSIMEDSSQEWTSTNCYDNILFKLKKVNNVGKRQLWELQFKNNYNQLVTFNYALTENETDFLTNKRKTLEAQSISKPIELYTNTEDFYVLVDQLSFSVSGVPLIPCKE